MKMQMIKHYTLSSYMAFLNIDQHTNQPLIICNKVAVKIYTEQFEAVLLTPRDCYQHNSCPQLITMPSWGSRS